MIYLSKLTTGEYILIKKAPGINDCYYFFKEAHHEDLKKFLTLSALSSFLKQHWKIVTTGNGFYFRSEWSLNPDIELICTLESKYPEYFI